MKTARGTLKDHVISIAVVPPIERHTHGEFGWSLAGDQLPVSFKQLESLLPRVAVSWVKLPVWYGESEPERGEQLVLFTERVSAKDIEVVGVIDRPPDDLDFGKRIADDVTIADLLSVEEPSAWLPSLDEVLTRLSLRVRYWQLGTDRDTSFSDFHDLEQEIGTLREQLFRFGQEVKLGIGWPWIEQSPMSKQATWDFQQYSASPSLTGDEIATYLTLPQRKGVARWVLIEPLERHQYELEVRTQDLVQQMLAAKIHGAEGIFVAEPFDDLRGLMSDTGTPGELLLPWRTTASLLGGATYLGTIQLPGGSENRVFASLEGKVIMVVWNQKQVREVLYLGDEVRVVDVWGRTDVPITQAHRQVVEVSSMPKFILGLEPRVATWRMNVNFSLTHVPSVFGTSHNNYIKIKNSFGQGVGGFVQLHAPDGWQIGPHKIDFKLSAGEHTKRPFQIVLPFDADSGTSKLRADFEFAADRQYKFSIFRDITVGDQYIELDVQTRLDESGSLVVEQRIINHLTKPVDFKCLLKSRGRKQQRLQVYQLSNSQDLQKYVFPNGHELLGTELWLRAEELGGARVLNHRFMVEE